MKTIAKSTIPKSLSDYLAKNPRGKWNSIKEERSLGGDVAYKDIRAKLFEDQGGICAYCETKLNDAGNDRFRVEHFHPKSDNSSLRNWHLDWGNLLCTCNGGISQKSLYQLPKNLSCDAVKKDTVYDGHILDPLQIKPFPAVFSIDMVSGKLKANDDYCNKWKKVYNNQFSTTRELIENTISKLNLNCDRLCRERLIIIFHIEKLKAKYRLNKIPSALALTTITKHFFDKHWPAYFTTIRLSLGKYAEEYLSKTNYSG